MQNGGESFANIGVENSGGTKIFSVSGHVERPGNYEIPMGMPFKTLLELSGTAVPALRVADRIRRTYSQRTTKFSGYSSTCRPRYRLTAMRLTLTRIL